MKEKSWLLRLLSLTHTHIGWRRSCSLQSITCYLQPMGRQSTQACMHVHDCVHRQHLTEQWSGPHLMHTGHPKHIYMFKKIEKIMQQMSLETSDAAHFYAWMEKVTSYYYLLNCTAFSIRNDKTYLCVWMNNRQFIYLLKSNLIHYKPERKKSESLQDLIVTH